MTGRVTSLFLAGLSLGGMTLPWLIGQTFESIGPRVTMFAVTAAMVLATIVFVLIVRVGSPVERKTW